MEEKKLSIIEKIILSLIVFITGFWCCCMLMLTSVFFIGSPPTSSLSTKMKIANIIFIGIYLSLPMSIFVLLLLNINEQCNITLVNYFKCLIVSFIFSAIIFYLIMVKNEYKSNNSNKSIKTYNKYRFKKIKK